MSDQRGTQTSQIEDGFNAGMFLSHNVFARLSRGLDPSAPPAHSPSYDRSVETLPVQFDTSNSDDAERAQGEVMVNLASAVEAHCMATIVEILGNDIQTISHDDIEAWLRSSASDIRMDTRSNCGMDVIVDVELDAFVPTEDGNVSLGLGQTSVLNGMARHQPMEDPLYVVIASQHLIALAGHLSLYFTHHRIGEDNDFLSGSAVFPYTPRLLLSPGAVKVARIEFESEVAWRTASLSSLHAAAVVADTTVPDDLTEMAPHTLMS